jgi:hypothetical protein
MEPEASLPGLRTIEHVMGQTTERLALECANPTAQAPDWSELHWCLAQAVAAIHGVSALLSGRLRWQGPRRWREFLSEQRNHTCARHERISALLEQLDAAAREAKLSLVALKGVALYGLGIYAPGERPMADVDLLVREADFDASVLLLESLRYRQSYRSRREHVFEPEIVGQPAHFGEHGGNAMKIELHTRIAERLPIREADISELLLPQSTPWGLQRYRSPAALMTHLLLHAAGGMRARALRLIQLNDIAALATHLDTPAWQQLLGGQRGAPWWLFPPLALTARYFPAAIPAPVLAHARSACPPLLRLRCGRQRLADVSLSDLWVRAFPGIEWCRSVPEALRYMQCRVFPDRQTRNEIRQCEATQLWALNTSWSKASRSRRVARWLISRCPRDVTMAPIKAAWARAGTTPWQPTWEQ